MQIKTQKIYTNKTKLYNSEYWYLNYVILSIYQINDGKSGFVSHTKHIAEATNMDLFHS